MYCFCSKYKTNIIRMEKGEREKERERERELLLSHVLEWVARSPQLFWRLEDE